MAKRIKLKSAETEPLNDSLSSESDDDEVISTSESDELEDDDETYHGAFNSQGQSHGRGTLMWPSSGDIFKGRFKNGLKEGRGCFYFRDGSILSGTFKDDLLNGEGVYRYEDGRYLAGVYLNGSLNGLCREYDKHDRLIFEGHYQDDVRRGFVRTWDDCGGTLLGEVDEKGNLSGDNIMYIYPDQKTALVGRFKFSKMVSARPAKLLESPTTCNKVPNYQLIEGFDPIGFDQSSKGSISSNPLVPDAYEQALVYVGQSDIPNAGEGLFAKCDLPENTVSSFYNGIRLTHHEVDSRVWELNDNTISLDDKCVIDVPNDCAILDNYVATLGHKANHSFSPNCEYAPFCHPRFGDIKCIRTIAPIPKGNELTCNYGYDHKIPGSSVQDLPCWYTKS